MVKEYPIDLSGLSRSNLSHHRTAQSMEMEVEVEGATTPVRMFGGPILLYLTRGSQWRNQTLSAP